ncbi:MAG: phage baseplate assembly protein V [Thermohalobaculum sp.]
MEQLAHFVRAHADQAAVTLAQPRLAVVSSVDSSKYLVRVRLQPEDALSGWLPLLTWWLGEGWGIACPPAPGDQVLVVWQEGDAENGVVLGRVPSTRNMPPPAPVGELWLRHKQGASIRLLNDGTIASRARTWVHEGDLVVNGDIRDRHGTLAALRGHFNSHVHPPGVTTPTPTD